MGLAFAQKVRELFKREKQFRRRLLAESSAGFKGICSSETLLDDGQRD
jgi:hypothetical protein